MKKIPIYLLIPSLLLFFLVVYDYWFVFEYKTGRANASGAGGSEAFGYISDVRQMNQYLSWLLVVVSLIINWAGNQIDDLKEKKHVILPFFIVVIAATSSLLFFPVPYLDQNINLVKWRWLASLIAEQAAVLFTISGVLSILHLFYWPKK